jgi:hypothetical protein
MDRDESERPEEVNQEVLPMVDIEKSVGGVEVKDEDVTDGTRRRQQQNTSAYYQMKKSTAEGMMDLSLLTGGVILMTRLLLLQLCFAKITHRQLKKLFHFPCSPIAANANQLKFILYFNKDARTFYPALVLIILSLILQVAVGILLIFRVSRVNTNIQRSEVI